MSSWPRITVVTPSFNQGAFLEATLRSVLDQKYPNLEYLVMDGGSSDDSVEIIHGYKDQLTYWQSQKDGGQADAINQGFRRATGDILCWINSDDLLKPDALRTIARIFVRPAHARQTPQWAIGGAEIIDSDGRLLGNRAAPDTKASALFDWKTKWFAQQATCWTRRMWELAGPLDADLHYCMDYDLWLRMYPFAKPLIVPTVLAAYRQHDSAKCFVSPERVQTELVAVLSRATRTSWYWRRRRYYAAAKSFARRWLR